MLRLGLETNFEEIVTCLGNEPVKWPIFRFLHRNMMRVPMLWGLWF